MILYNKMHRCTVKVTGNYNNDSGISNEAKKLISDANGDVSLEYNNDTIWEADIYDSNGNRQRVGDEIKKYTPKQSITTYCKVEQLKGGNKKRKTRKTKKSKKQPKKGRKTRAKNQKK
jgi:hypothetical protein